MGPCERNADRWLDHLYGLLQDAESRELGDHLAICPNCRVGLTEAERDQRRMARAAIWHRNIPEFNAPTEMIPMPAATAPLAVPAVEEGPVVVQFPKPRRRLVRRLTPVWAAAAAILVAFFGGLELYRRGADERKQAVDKTRNDLQDIKTRFAKLTSDATAEQRALTKQAGGDVLRLAVVGATQTDPAAPYVCRVATRNLDGQAVPADLDVKLVRADTGELVHKQTVKSAGVAEVVIPGGLKLGQDVRLEVAAKHGTSEAQIRETIHTAPSGHVAHLALSKAVAQLGEVVFFRALVLDRFSLTPPPTPVPLKFTLVNPKGDVVATVTSPTAAGGIATGEFALAKLKTDIYTVQVAAADTKARVQGHTQSLEVVERLADFDVRQDRKFYHVGEKVVMDVTVRDENGQPIKQKLVEVKAFTSKGPGIEKAAPAGGGFTNDQGRAKIQFTVPDKFDGSSLRVQLDIKHGKGLKTTRTIPILPSRLEVDFYPEGGDLVAGLPQRVFFRVRTPRGETVVPEKGFVLSSSKGEVYRAKNEESLGSFTFTPDAKETYTLKLPGGGEAKEPFAKLGIKPAGVVMSVANTVAGEGEAVRAELARNGIDQPLFFAAVCRGQVVAHEFVEPAAKSVQLVLPKEVRGIVRLTVYEVRDQRLTPLAERLVYRAPAQHLDFNATTENFQPGKTASIKIEAKDEKKQPATLWALALVVEEQYRTRKEQGLAGQFFLGGDLEDLAEAPLLASDSPETRTALELFLGTHGWRRFVAPTAVEPAQVASVKTGLFSVEGPSAEQLRTQFGAKAQAQALALQTRTQQERAQLEEQRERLAGNLVAAIEARGAYERMPMEYFRLSLGLLALAALAAGSGFILLGAVRVLRQRSPRTSFGSAFGALALCMGLYFGSGALNPAAINNGKSGPLAESQPLPQIPLAFPTKAIAIKAASLSGQVALAEPGTGFARDANVSRNTLDLAGAVALVGGEPVLPATKRATFVDQKEMKDRFEEAEKRQQGPATEKQGTWGREFAHRNEAGFEAQPVLVWHPNLQLVNGQARVGFDVPAAPTSYRILVLGHDAQGNFGFYENHVNLKLSGN